ncbi:uncharacterized protein LOC131200007 [Ahaetulla prasina]|uniref:uncharacterized protein LOC131200007 n=1 Tax=Ahaetulla prasina TaxID=499056 RepID=UPI0026476CA9|nr:uncharacterized protein LOC131200007 [Ahaetulla prasina]
MGSRWVGHDFATNNNNMDVCYTLGVSACPMAHCRPVVPRPPPSPQPGPSHLLLSQPETDNEDEWPDMPPAPSPGIMPGQTEQDEWPGMPPAPSPGTMPGQTEQINLPPTACEHDEHEASHELELPAVGGWTDPRFRRMERRRQ